MVKQRSADKFPNRAASSKGFPSFGAWVRYISLFVAITFLYSLVIFPLLSKVAVWIQPALDEQLNDFLTRHIARWNRKSDPRILRVGVFVAVFLVVAYPIFALLDRFCRWLSTLRHPPNKDKIKKKRIT